MPKFVIAIRSSLAINSYISMFISMTAIIVCIIAGYAFPYLFPSQVEYYIILILVIVVAGVSVMPQTLRRTDTLLWSTFQITIVMMAIYPWYLAIQVAGLPFINPQRVVIFMMTVIWLYEFKFNQSLRQRLLIYISKNRFFTILICIFIFSQLLGTATSTNFGVTLQKFLMFQLTWTFPLIVAVSVIHSEARLRRFIVLLVVGALLQCVIGFVEWRQQSLVWLYLLPQGFGADNEVFARILQGAFRFDVYRVQGSFSVSLVYAEFLVMMLPFALLVSISKCHPVIRAIGIVTTIATLPAIYMSGSRLGFMGMAVCLTVFIILRLMKHSQKDRNSMLRPLAILAVPVVLSTVTLAILSIPRLRVLAIGGAQHQASTDGRIEQWLSGLGRIAQRPLFGYGPGAGAETLGYTNPAGVVSIDSYWLSALLEFGLVGGGALAAIFAWAAVMSARLYLSGDSDWHRVGISIASAIAAFCVVKLVLAQIDVHMFAFLFVGVAVASVNLAKSVSPDKKGGHLLGRRFAKAPAIHGWTHGSRRRGILPRT